MLLFSTILHTTDALNADAFIDLAIRCNQENPHPANRVPGAVRKPKTREAHYGTPNLSFDIREYGDDSQDEPASAREAGTMNRAERRRAQRKQKKNKKGRRNDAKLAESPTKQAELSALARSRSHIVAIRYQKVEDGIHWTTDYVLNLTTRILLIRLERTYRQGGGWDGDYSAPSFISYLADGGYLPDDGPFPVNGDAIDLDAALLPAFADVVRGRTPDVSKPLVYVPRREDGTTVLDADALASKLRGVAHVIVESDHSMDQAIADACGIDLATDDRVDMLFPGDGSPCVRDTYSLPRHAADATGEMISDNIRQDMRHAMAGEDVPAWFTWDGVNTLIYERESKTLQEQYDKAAESLKQMAARLWRLHESAAASKAQQDDFDREIEERDARLEELSARFDKQESDLDEQRRQNQDKDSRLRDIHEEYRRREKRLKDELKKERDNKQKSEDALMDALTTIEELQSQISQFKEASQQAEAETRRLQAQTERLKAENARLQERSGGEGGNPVLSYGRERDFFDGEIRDYVLEAVSHERQNTRGSEGAKRMRKADVLDDILAANAYERLHERRREKIKGMGARFVEHDSQLDSDLSDLGFRRIRDANHIVYEYGGDSRYRITVSKTPSDFRSGENMAAKFNMITQ